MSDFATANLLIENMDAGLDGPLSSREVACVEKGWMHGEKSASAELTRLQSEVERLRGRLDQLEALLKASDRRASVATEALETEAENHTKLRNSLHSGGWLLRKQAEAVEAVSENLKAMCKVDYRRWVKPAVTELDNEAQRLRQQADEAEKAGGGDA